VSTRSRLRLASIPAAVWFAAAACSVAPDPTGHAARPPDGALDELRALDAARNYFALRDRVAAMPDATAPEVQYFQAVVHHAFNDPARSNVVAAALLARPSTLPESTVFELQRLELRNHLRLFEYSAAAAKTAAILEAPPVSAKVSDLSELRNLLRIFRALQDVPAQQISSRRATRLRPDGGRIPITIESTTRQFVFDTGANLSVLMRSEAERLGLQIREAGVEVGTVTDLRPTADLAIAARLEIGGVELRNVVFLVMPDELLSFPDGHRIPGIVGFPVIEALGEVVFGADGTIEIPETPADGGTANLALAGLKLLTLVGHRNSRFICQFDTGADATDFYAPFFKAHEADVTQVGTLTTLRSTGVGGTREFDGYRLPRLEVTVAGRALTLLDVDVYAAPVREEEYLHCNIGQDVLRQVNGYRLNFRSMTLTFGDEAHDPRPPRLDLH